jgi:integrase/recombinase XerD
MRDLPNALARALYDFFSDDLPRLRGVSPHTVYSYRDSLAIFLRFVASRGPKSVAELDLNDLGPQEVIAFLHYLKDDRHNTPSTSNVRLAALHAFFRYIAARHPERLEQCQRILGVPFKRTHHRSIEYLEYDEIQIVLAAIDRTTRDGRRDYALLATMFNTGARVQEALDLRACDLQLVKPYHVRLLGKGRKERLCPLWRQTAELLQALLAETASDARSRERLFRNHRGEPLTRFGVRYILAKYCNRVRTAMPSLSTKRLHPHSMRHSTAVHLLRAGVDLTTISSWLGHASIDITSRYATVDLEAKRQAIAKVQPLGDDVLITPWQTEGSLLKWLEAL